MSERDERLARAVEILRDAGDEDARLYEGYSGRGMFGRTCTGVVTSWSVAAVGWACGAAGLELDEVPARTDSLGYQTIVY